jgi:hypothetical protein
MTESANVIKFRNCKNAHTSDCPHEDHSAMKRIIGDKETWRVKHSKPVDKLTNDDYEKAASLCENCEAFKSIIEFQQSQEKNYNG